MKYKSKNNQFITSVFMACVIAITALGCGSGADFDIADDPVITNNVPVITSTPIFGGAPGFEYSYTLTATDADADDTLTMSATAPAWLTFDAETGVLSGTPTDEDEGENSVTLTVSDGSDQVSQTFSVIVVVPPNNVPVITSTAITMAVVDTEYSYTLTATDTDPNDSVSLSASTVPAWLDFDAETGILSGTPATEDIGNHAVSLLATDGIDVANQDFSISVTETAVTSFVIFDDSERADWPAWDCCAGSVPTVETDDVDHDAVVEFSIGADPTVMGFIARDGDGAVGGVPFDARPFIESGTFSFDLKMTASPGDTDWMFKVESAIGQTPVEVNLSTSNEGHAAPVLDTWLTYTFNLIDLQNAGLDVSKIDVVMFFPAWGTGEGAVYRVDNVVFSAGGSTTPPPGDGNQIDLPITFDDAAVDYTVVDFGGAATGLGPNPTDAADQVAMTTKTDSAETWAGTTMSTDEGLATPVPLTLTESVMKIWVYSPDAGVPVRLKLENHLDNTQTVETESVTTLVDTWEELTFDFTNEAAGTEPLDPTLHPDWIFDKASIFFNFGTDGATAGQKTYYWDDVSFGGDAPPPPPPAASELVIFDDAERADWPAWDCCGGSTPTVEVDDAEYGAVVEFSIGASPTVMGFTAREVDGAVGGTPFDATSIVANGTLSFDLKMTGSPGDTDWLLKLESNGGATPVEVGLTTSTEGHAAPVLDTWQHYTFNLADLQTAGLDVSGIDVVMVFPAWGTGNGAIYRIDNVSFLEGEIVEPPVTTELVIYDDSERADWPAWDCCGGSTPLEQTDDVDHGAVMEFAIGGAPTVMGFTARDGDGAVGGTPFDATAIVDSGTLSFDLKMTATPGDTAWLLKLESNGGATPVEVDLSTSNEGHAAPVLDTWLTYTFNLADLQTAGLDVSAIDVVMVFPAWGTGDGAIYRLDNVSFLEGGSTPPSDAEIVIFDDTERADWPAWDCCGGSTPVEQTDDVDHGAVMEFAIGAAPTVMGFTARDVDGAVGGTPFDASTIVTTGTLSFDFKMTATPGDTAWLLKLESNGGATPVEVNLSTSNEGHAAPVLDTWQTYTFNLADLQTAGLDVSGIDVVMVFPAWGTGNGAIYRLDNVNFLPTGNTAPPPPPGGSQIDLPINFDDAGVDFTVIDFGGTSTVLGASPTDGADQVAITTKSNTAETWAGTTMSTNDGLATAVPLTLVDSIMKVWVYSPDAGIPVRLKLENHLDPTQTVETESVTTLVNTWEQLTFDFTNEAAGTEPLDPALHPTWIFDKPSIFFNFGTTGADAGEKVYYWDDITFGN